MTGEPEDASLEAGRCAWCGKPISLCEGDQLDLDVFDDARVIEGEPMTVDSQALANAVADALEGHGGPRDAMLADHIREHRAYRLHDRCYRQSSLPSLYEDL